MIFNDVDGKQKATCTIRVLILKTFHDGRYRFVIESVIYNLINNYSGFILTGRLFWQGEGFGHELFPVTNKYNAWRWKNKKNNRYFLVRKIFPERGHMENTAPPHWYGSTVTTARVMCRLSPAGKITDGKHGGNTGWTGTARSRR